MVLATNSVFLISMSEQLGAFQPMHSLKSNSYDGYLKGYHLQIENIGIRKFKFLARTQCYLSLIMNL